jgi:hypothetical protein
MPIIQKRRVAILLNTEQITETTTLRETLAMTYAMFSGVQIEATITAVLQSLLLLKVHQTAITALAIIAAVEAQLHHEENFRRFLNY